MSVTLIQGPTSGMLYAKNTVPKIILYATEGVHTIVYFRAPEDGNWEPDNIMIEATYAPDFAGRVTLDFEKLFDVYAKTLFPISSGNNPYQEEYYYYFSAEIKGVDSNDTYNILWRVANAELHSAQSFYDWSDENYLTNQPAEKRTNKDAPEFLTYLDDAQGDRIMKVIFYPKGGGSEKVTVFTSPERGCYTVDVSYSKIIQLSSYLPSQLNGYYDVVVSDTKGSEHQSQRYLFEECNGREKYFLFVNELGGIDTLICDGENVLQPEITLNVGRFDRGYVALRDADNIRKWTQQTGLMPYKYRDWIHELLTCAQGAWKYSGSYQPIVLKTAEIAMSDNGQLASANFSYIETTASAIERDSTYHQSIADQSEDPEDITIEEDIHFEQVEQEYETPVMVINASKVYVTAQGTGTIDYYINGTYAGTIDIDTARMPVVIEVESGDEIQFKSETEIARIAVNYYPESRSNYEENQNE